MTPQEIYAKLAEFGYTLDEAVAATDKLIIEFAKFDGQPKNAGFFKDSIQNLINGGLDVSTAALIGLPFAGYFGGKYLAKQVDDSNSNVQELQETELISELQQNIDKLRQRRHLKELGHVATTS